MVQHRRRFSFREAPCGRRPMIGRWPKKQQGAGRKIRRLVGSDHRWALEGPISQRSAWADRETGASAKGVVHLFAARSRFQRLVGDFKSQYVFLLSHGYNSFRLPAALAVRRSIRKPERPPSAMAYDPMQTLQSQLGKSLSLQLLMTVPRRRVPSDNVIRLQGIAFASQRLLPARVIGLTFEAKLRT